ncbi:MAG: hypothetical protein ACXWLY_31365 [Thermoanaerobaculia bacterium]
MASGQAMRILRVSYSQLYKLIDRGVLTPRNRLHPKLRGRRRHTYEFDEAEVRRVAGEIEADDDRD